MSKKISCECLRVGVLVGDDQYFAGTGNKVDANLSVALALGLSDVLVAGTDNHVDRKNALGTIGERCNGLHAAESVDFVRAGEIHGDKRFGIVRNTVVSIIFSVTFLLVLYLCVLLMLTGKRFLLWLDALMPRVSIIWSWTWVRFLVLFAILQMMILVLYRLTTPRRAPHLVLPGALFSAVGIVVMSILLSWLIGNSAKYSLVYGSLASVVILLFWFHVFGLLLILGVVLNHALEVTAPPKKEA